MVDLLFDFEEGKLPPAVLIATGILIALFAIGIPIRLALGLF
ncbi:hypothetical protein ACLI4Z_15600 [Natrialbaceae archaeon A-arb3/5]